ncbi:zf-MYND and TPR domain-containing protein [Skeletonema marinoi]|uniref:Zf-MYND and TPR domain-containing protein n=1 Tax=Skeletonema marinoi TaxID=267567 RepID=A0AAD8YAQ7_9STRA|nr:zf-MYND and TPR domain-containing protein [Skeletonema marinoi]
MRSEAETIDEDTCCASCGVAEGDDIKLKNCTACHLVKYCGVKCQKEHRPQHKRECKKRAAELHDEILFKQPENSHLGDCVQKDIKKAIYHAEQAAIGGHPGSRFNLGSNEFQSGKVERAIKHWIIASNHGHDDSLRMLRESYNKRFVGKEDFAAALRAHQAALDATKSPQREAGEAFYANQNEHRMPKTHEDADKAFMKRVEANDPAAQREFGNRRLSEGDHVSALECWTKAAELGDLVAHFELQCFYRDGKGVEKDMKKVIYHAEQAAIGGHPMARYNLGGIEWENGRKHRAVKHWIIAANLGDDEALGVLRECYDGGFISKEDFSATLRTHQAALDATKSPQREAAEVFYASC